MTEAITREQETINQQPLLPKGAVPYPEYSDIWNNQDSVMSMRWENKELISQLRNNLAYMHPKTIGGAPYLVPTSDAKPPINYEGTKMVITMVKSVVNTVGSLSKIHQDHALKLYGDTKASLRRSLIIHAKRFGCETRADKQHVAQLVGNIVFLQLMRAVAGHESNQSRTNLVERKDEGNYRQETKGGGRGLPNPFGGGGGQ